MIKVASPQIGREEIKAVSKVLKSGKYVSGELVREFEQAFAKYIGVEHAIAVNSGTAALHCALKAAGVGEYDEVVVPALSFFATVEAVIHAGAKPVFCDISLDNYCMDPDDLQIRVNNKTKAIIPVHLFGNSAEIHDLPQSLRIGGSIVLIEDCAQAHGAEYDGGKVGAWGDLGVFSFFATKNMTTGEGGMVTTDDPKYAEFIRKFRSHGMSDRHTHEFIGYNYRMTEIEAAIGLIQLEKLDEYNAARSEIAKFYSRNLAGLFSWMRLPTVAEGVEHAWFWYPVLIDEDALGMMAFELAAYLKGRGIEVRQRYRVPLYKQPALRHADLLPSGNRPNAEAVAGKIIGLPNRPNMSNRELETVVEVLSDIK